MEGANHQPKLHALFIAYPLQGHVIPSVHLAIKLASKGFIVTFVNTQSIHHNTSCAHPGRGDDIFADTRKMGLDIRYEIISDGLPVEFDRSLNHDQFMESILHVFSAHVEELICRINVVGPPITCLIADTFFVWPATIARKFNLLYVSFWTETALVFTLYYHMYLLRQNGHFGNHDNREDPIDYIPGVASIEPSDLMSYLQDTEISTVVHRIIFKAFEEAKLADYVLCNSVTELEPDTISALHQKIPFYAIGPICPPGATISAVPTSLWAEEDCTHWLNTKPHGSVLFISFGSYAHVEKSDLHEIAKGVLDSKTSFLWVLRPDIVSSCESNPLPEGFMEGDGLVVQWCKQSSVLSHPAVGGFLTHCGWNSVLESVWCGVPMLCFPLLTDQFTNRRLVVGEWRVGKNISGGNGKKVRREAVAKGIEGLMRGEEGKGMRREMEKVKRVLQEAVVGEGSSVRNMDHFVEDITNRVRVPLITKNCNGWQS